MGISVVMCYSWLVNLKEVDIIWNNNVFSLWWTPSFLTLVVGLLTVLELSGIECGVVHS